MDFERLRTDLVNYARMAKALDLPCAAASPEEAEAADEAGLVAMAADQGWDFKKYLSENDKKMLV